MGLFRKESLPNFFLCLFTLWELVILGSLSSSPLSPEDLHNLLQGLSAPLRGMVALYTDCFCRGAEESVIQEGIKPCQRVGLLKYLSDYAASGRPQGDAEVPEMDL